MSHSNEELLEEIYDKAFDNERKYGFCPQAVLAALDDYFDIVEDQVIKSIHALAGGGALCGDGTCGALIGGMVAISSVFGRKREEFGSSNENNWTSSSWIAKKLRSRFINEYGSVICNDVQEEIMGRSFDLWDPKDYKCFEEAGAHEDKCTKVSANVAKWTAEILIEEGLQVKN